MAGSLNPNFSNNVNIVAIRPTATKTELYTDRAIDLNGDSIVEAVVVTITQEGPGNKIRRTVVETAGSSRTIVDNTNETDQGIDTTGVIFTTGVG